MQFRSCINAYTARQLKLCSLVLFTTLSSGGLILNAQAALCTNNTPSVPGAPNQFDETVEEFWTQTGTLQVANGGESLFPNNTTGNFTVNLAACTGGVRPTISAAFLSWYSRWRSLPGDLATTPTFDNQINVAIGAANGTVTATNDVAQAIDNNPAANNDIDDIFESVQDGGGGNTVIYRYHAVADIGATLRNALAAGSNTITISDFSPPPEANDFSENYGVGLTVIYSCPNFPNARISFHTGLDFFWADQSVNRTNDSCTGDFSEQVCVTFPAEASDRTFTIDAILGGQQQAAPPLRGNRLFYQTGTGTPPAVAPDVNNSPQPFTNLNPLNTAFELGRPGAVPAAHSIWSAMPGQEWDVVSGVEFTVPASHTYACIQALSTPNGAQTGGSLDMLGPAFKIPQTIVTPPVFDFGDLSVTGTTFPVVGAGAGNHQILTTNNPFLGAVPPDAEADGQPSNDATGDDINGNPDDEDGVIFPTLTVGQQSTITVTTNNPGGGTLCLTAWIDWNGNGTFDASDVVTPATGLDVAAGGAFSINVTPPADTATNQSLGTRWRLSSACALTPGSNAADGEVEDHIVSVLPAGSTTTQDCGDLPTNGTTFPVTGTGAGCHDISTTNNPFIGQTPPDPDTDGQPTPNADGDDGDGSDDEGCVGLPPSGLTLGQQDNVSILINNPGATNPLCFNAWIDWNNNGTFDAGDQIANGLDVSAGGNFLIPVTPPANTVLNQSLGTRLRVSSACALAPGGLAPDGEIEDCTISVQPNVDIPTLSQWAMMILSLLLLAIFGIVLKRRAGHFEA